MHLQENEASSSNEQKWGFELRQLYQLAIKFYKEKEGKALQLSYASRLQFAGLSQQVAHGPCRIDSLPPLGVLDVVGHDRREAWQRLGELGRPDAMARYIELLDAACPIFRPFAEAHKRDLEAQTRSREEERAVEEQRRLKDETERRRRELESSRQAETKRHIQDVLNRQTYSQFRAYAAQQYPDNPGQQAVLIRKLQQQHYQQYMLQLFHQHQQSPATGPETDIPDSASKTAGHNIPSQQIAEDVPGIPHLPEMAVTEATNGGNPEHQHEVSAELPVASMWTRGDLAQFKEARRAERDSSVLTVGQGQVVTVRVPAGQHGTCLFWEFATDSFDLGFGVLFEWGPTTQHQVTVEVGSGAAEEPAEGTVLPDEEGPASAVGRRAGGTSCVVPVYRRDCHQHVYAGSHRFPAHQGVYLLKFDNSYSLWRAKTLYYRVFYTK